MQNQKGSLAFSSRAIIILAFQTEPYPCPTPYPPPYTVVSSLSLQPTFCLTIKPRAWRVSFEDFHNNCKISSEYNHSYVEKELNLLSKFMFIVLFWHIRKIHNPGCFLANP